MKTYVITTNNIYIYDNIDDIVCFCDSLDDALIEQKRLKENNPYLDYRVKSIEKY